MKDKENNFLIDLLVVLLSVLLIPLFTIKSIICDKSIMFYIIELRNDLQKLEKDEEK